MSAAVLEEPAPLRHNRTFTVLMAGNSVNDLGTAVGVVALTLIVYDYSRSPVLVGVVDAVELLTLVLCGLPAGWMADRLPKARVLASAAAVGAVAYAGMAVVVASGCVSVAVLIGVVVVIGASSSLYAATSRATVRAVVRAEDVGDATTLVQARGAVALVIGAPIGGALFGWHEWFPLAFDAVSYVAAAASAVTLRRIPIPPGAQEGAQTSGAAALAGLRFLWRSRSLRGVAVLGIATGFASGGLLMSLIVSLQQRHYPYAVIGGVQSACAVGMIVGAIAAPAALRKYAVGRFLPGCLSFLALSYFVVAVARPSWVILAALGAGCLPVVPIVSALTGYEANVVPANLQGRVSAADRVLTDSASAIAPLVGGFLLQTGGSLVALLTFAVTMAAAGLYARVDPHVHSIPLISSLSTERTLLSGDR